MFITAGLDYLLVRCFAHDLKNLWTLSPTKKSINPWSYTHSSGCFSLLREDGELEDGEIDDEGIGIEEENKEATEVNDDKDKEKEKEKEKEKLKEKEEKTHRHSRKRYKKTREKRRSKRRRRDRQKVSCSHQN